MLQMISLKLLSCLQNLEHSTEVVRSLINSLQSEAKMIKDPNSVKNTNLSLSTR